MGLSERIDIYQKIEAHRNCPLIVYVTSKRRGIEAEMSTDALPQLIEQLDELPVGTTKVDFMIASFGGDPMVAWRIMSLLRERVDWVSVLIPQSAYSGATLLALGGNEIYMHPNGHLGPVDMQILSYLNQTVREYSTEDISAFIEFVRQELSITDQAHLRKLFEATISEVSTLGVGFTARSSKLAASLAEKLLRSHMKDDDAGSKCKALSERLSHQFHSHSYPVSRKEAIEIGLPINQTRDPVFESLMWQVWLDIEEELKERERFSVVSELLKDDEVSKMLLAPAPQLSLPANAASPNNFTATLEDVTNTISKNLVRAVEFQCTEAVIESSRLAHSYIRKGKIIASRQPDLTLLYNILVSSHRWEQTRAKRGLDHVSKESQ